MSNLISRLPCLGIFLLVASIIFSLMAYLAQFWFSFGGTEITRIAIAGGVGLAAHAVLTALSQKYPLQLRKERVFDIDRNTLEATLNAILSVAIDNITHDANARACVFVPNKKNDELRIIAHTPSFPQDEKRKLRFTKEHQGIVGHVFWGDENHEPQSINLENVPDKEKKDRWKLTQQQIDLTRHVKYVVAVVIRFENRGDLVGILSVDSPNSVSVSNLDQETIVDKIVGIAQTIAETMQKLIEDSEWSR